MFDMMLVVYENLNNYVFGSNIFTVFAFMFLIYGFMVVKGFSFDVMLIMTLVFTTVGAVWLFPVWLSSLTYMIAGLIVGYIVSKIITR